MFWMQHHFYSKNINVMVIPKYFYFLAFSSYPFVFVRLMIDYIMVLLSLLCSFNFLWFNLSLINSNIVVYWFVGAFLFSIIFFLMFCSSIFVILSEFLRLLFILMPSLVLRLRFSKSSYSRTFCARATASFGCILAVSDRMVCI